MANLQDGILLYTHDARAVLVSDSVERFLGVGPRQDSGRRLHDVLPARPAGRWCAKHSTPHGPGQEEITTETGRHVEISLDSFMTIELSIPRRPWVPCSPCTMSNRYGEIESDLELSRRLAAIGRLTAGVGHEVKNPINAIVVHLELLRNKLGDPIHRAMRHLEVIESEIQRLDRVVQTLVDFSRPVELQLREQDLRPCGRCVGAGHRRTFDPQRTLAERPADQPMMAKVDSDLFKQAILNVMLNGAQAMPEGGSLEVTLERNRRRKNGNSAAHRRPGGWHSRRNSRQNLRSLLHHQKRRQRNRTGHDISNSSVASRRRGRTIETGQWHRIQVAHSVGRHGMGSPASSAGGHRRDERVWEMKPVRILMCLLPLLLSACTHNAKQAQIQSLAPPIEDTPPPPPDSAPANLPAPVIPIPKTETPVVVQEQPKPAPRHHKPKPRHPARERERHGARSTARLQRPSLRPPKSARLTSCLPQSRQIQRSKPRIRSLKSRGD